MYYYHANSVVGVPNDWDLATTMPSPGTSNTDRTGTIPFMALELLSGDAVVHMYRHDVESFIWVFLWVCSCSDGSKKEVLVAPYKKWMKLDIVGCMEKRGNFISRVDLDDIGVSDYHASNGLFCLFLAWLLQQLRVFVWKKFPRSADPNPFDQKDMALFKDFLLPKFREVRDELNKEFSPKDWLNEESQSRIQDYLGDTVRLIVERFKKRGHLDSTTSPHIFDLASPRSQPCLDLSTP